MRKRRNSRHKSPILPVDIKMTAARRRKLNKYVFVLMCVCFLSAAFHLYPAYKNMQPQIQSTALKGIIIDTQAMLYPIPSILSENKAMQAQVGEEVIITNQTDGWYQVQVPQGKFWIEPNNLMLAENF